MAQTDLGGAEASDLTNQMVAYNVSEETTDAADGMQETTWQKLTANSTMN